MSKRQANWPLLKQRRARLEACLNQHGFPWQQVNDWQYKVFGRNTVMVYFNCQGECKYRTFAMPKAVPLNYLTELLQTAGEPTLGGMLRAEECQPELSTRPEFSRWPPPLSEIEYAEGLVKHRYSEDNPFARDMLLQLEKARCEVLNEQER